MKPSVRLGRFYLVLGIIAVVGAAALGYAVLSSRRADAGQARRADLSGLDAVPVTSLGRMDAPVIIVEFIDFQCPGCRIFALEEMPRVKSQLIDTGLARLVLVDFPMPTHDHARLAARAARCAGDQGEFWTYHDTLFASAPDWSFQDDPTPTFVGFAEVQGLDASRFETCLQSEKFVADVEAARTFGTAIGVRGTPAVFVDSEFMPNATFEKIEQRIRALTAPGT